MNSGADLTRIPVENQTRGDGAAPVISLAAFEGPLDLLLDLARRRRIDLLRIPMGELVDACLAALAALPSVRERAETLVLAADLALLKSRLLLPVAQDAETDGAARLRRRLERLALVRGAATALMARDRLGRETFARGASEDPVAPPAGETELDLLTLVRAYADIRLRAEPEPSLALRQILAMSVGDALPLVEGVVAAGRGDWVGLFNAVGVAARGGEAKAEVSKRSVASASFAAALEMARRGEVDVRQDGDGEVSVRER